MKAIEFILWIALGLLLIWFFNSSAVLQIIIGFAIFALILARDTVSDKTKKVSHPHLEKASHETLYDAMKWVAFGIFVIVYQPLMDTHKIEFLVTVFVFILALLGINYLKEKNSP